MGFPGTMGRTLASAMLTTFALVVPSLAHAADKILILQWPNNGDPFGNAAADEAQMELTAAGYTDVTTFSSVNTAVPANVADYSQVYLPSIGPMGTSDATKLVTYVQNGGHLYVTGEHPDPNNLAANTFLQNNILKLVLKDSTGLLVGTGVEGGNGGKGEDLITLVAEKTAFAQHPASLASFYVDDPGIIGGVSDDHIFAKDQNSAPIGAVWTRSDLVMGNGCVMLVMDINWWDLAQTVTDPPPTQADVQLMVTHVADFMKYCGDHDLDGILDGDEPALATDPANPDTDGDGLCDGDKSVDDPTVTGKCIAGENGQTKQDSDKDGIIDALDPDDDNDGIASKDEVSDVATFGNPDKDGVNAWLDLDSDDDGVSDHDEGRKEFNAAGVPDYLDPDYPNVGGGGRGALDGGAGGIGGGGGGSDGGVVNLGVTSGTDSASGCGCVVEGVSDRSRSGVALGLFFGLSAIAWRRRRS